MMEHVLPLWLPTLVAAVAVFIASSLVHMVLKWHATDQSKLPNEDAVADALRGAAPGEYRLPWGGSTEEMKSPAFLEKAKRGPVAIVGISGGDFQKGFQRALILWFVYSLVVGFLAGHIAHLALGGNADAHDIFHNVGLAAFMGYGMALAQQSIWGPKKWWPTAKGMIDALIYGAITGAVFVWLWPK